MLLNISKRLLFDYIHFRMASASEDPELRRERAELADQIQDRLVTLDAQHMIKKALPLLALAQIAFAGQWCRQGEGPILCVTGIDKGESVDLTLEVDPNIGWFAFGTGSMAESDLIVGWFVNSTDKINPSTKTPLLIPVVSNRYWNGDFQPEVDTDPNSAKIYIYPDSGLILAGSVVKFNNPLTGKMESQEVVESRYILHLQRQKKDTSSQDLEWKTGVQKYIWAINVSLFVMTNLLG
jgi:hypothetical protein